MQKIISLTLWLMTLLVAVVGVLWWKEHTTRTRAVSDYATCTTKLESTAASCAQPTSTIPLLPATPPDRTADWKTYTDDQSGMSFRYPPKLSVTVDPALGDIALRTIDVGATFQLVGVAGGSEGPAGGNPADYGRKVYNSIAQNTKPNWSHYDPGYSSERLGNITLYRFHSNLFDQFDNFGTFVPQTGSFCNPFPTCGDTVPLQGVMFGKKYTWFVYFQPADQMTADDILRTLTFE